VCELRAQALVAYGALELRRTIDSHPKMRGALMLLFLAAITFTEPVIIDAPRVPAPLCIDYCDLQGDFAQ
jgi:hypothetical protein